MQRCSNSADAVISHVNYRFLLDAHFRRILNSSTRTFFLNEVEFCFPNFQVKVPFDCNVTICCLSVLLSRNVCCSKFWGK